MAQKRFLTFLTFLSALLSHPSDAPHRELAQLTRPDPSVERD
jgi:hypothetical protein